MAIDLGSNVPLSITIYNADGELEDAGTVTVSITLPDGTIFTPAAITSTSPGVYAYDYASVQVGRHNVRWLATGANASAYGDVFYVNPTDGGAFISLTHFKAHIKKTSSTDDDIMRTFITGACQMINDRMGQVSPITVVEDVTTINGFARLSKYPILDVVSVGVLPGLSVVDPMDGSQSITIGWGVESGILNIRRTGTFRITYRAGLEIIPANYILAALELTADLWRQSQQNAGGGRPTVNTDDQIVPGVTYALPYRVRQLLGLDKRPQAGVFVG